MEKFPKIPYTVSADFFGVCNRNFIGNDFAAAADFSQGRREGKRD